MRGCRTCDHKVTGVATVSGGAPEKAARRRRDEPEGEGERGGHPRVRRLTRSLRRESGRQGAVATGGELPRRPADGDEEDGEIRGLQDIPAAELARGGVPE